MGSQVSCGRPRYSDSENMTKEILAVAVIIYLSLGHPTASADYIVSEWSLLSHVYDSSTGDQDYHRFSTVQNPFQDSHSAALGISTVETAYDFAWSELAGTGSFNIQVALQVEDTLGFVSSDGPIHFDTTEDLSFTINIAYTYDLPGGALLAGFSALVLDVDTHEYFFAVSEQDHNFDGQPASGTFTAQGSAFLPAGRSYVLDYMMHVTSYANSGILGTGSGYIDFQITPEPATLSLLVLAAAPLLLPRRRRRR